VRYATTWRSRLTGRRLPNGRTAAFPWGASVLPPASTNRRAFIGSG